MAEADGNNKHINRSTNQSSGLPQIINTDMAEADGNMVSSFGQAKKKS